MKQYTLALLLADRTGFSEEEWEQYKQLGLLHLLAISGLHISLMALVSSDSLGEAALLERKRVDYWCYL